MSSYQHPSPFRRWRLYAFLGVLLLAAAVGIVTFLMGNGTPHLAYEYVRVGFSEERPYAYVDAEGHVTGECPEDEAPLLDELVAHSRHVRARLRKHRAHLRRTDRAPGRSVDDHQRRPGG